jgi:hypothetical protein
MTDIFIYCQKKVHPLRQVKLSLAKTYHFETNKNWPTFNAKITPSVFFKANVLNEDWFITFIAFTIQCCGMMCSGAR